MAVSTTGTRLSDTSSPVPECTPVSAHPADCRNSQFSVLLRHPIRNLENGAGICFANKLATEQLAPGLEACSGFLIGLTPMIYVVETAPTTQTVCCEAHE